MSREDIVLTITPYDQGLILGFSIALIAIFLLWLIIQDAEKQEKNVKPEPKGENKE